MRSIQVRDSWLILIAMLLKGYDTSYRFGIAHFLQFVVLNDGIFEIIID